MVQPRLRAVEQDCAAGPAAGGRQAAAPAPAPAAASALGPQTAAQAKICSAAVSLPHARRSQGAGEAAEGGGA